MEDKKPTYKYNAFIENTLEAREWLDRLGYVARMGIVGTKGKYIVTGNTYYLFTNANLEHKNSDIVYYCLGNFPLFKAITAITDDNDKDQYFKFKNGEFRMCHWENHIEYFSIIDFNDKPDKATPEELINYFKK